MLTGCGDSDVSDAASTDPALVPTPVAVELPEQVIDVGAVVDGRAAQATGNGPAVIAFDAVDEFALVAALDCGGCHGPVEVSSPGQGTAWGSGEGPVSAQYLVQIAGPEPMRQLVVDAEGDWRIDLSSVDDLPAVTGVQQGTGSTVLRIDQPGTTLRVAYTPADAQDELTARMMSWAQTGSDGEPLSMSFGADSAFDQSYPLVTPGVIALDTAGSWTVQPLP